MYIKEVKKHEYSAEYISYLESGESAAVFVTRDIVNSINTKGKWIDVISLNRYYKQSEYKFAFNWIIVEIFPRNIQPEYIENNEEYNKYITWYTSHKDIENQRKKGYKGEKYIILCHLYNENKGKFTRSSVKQRKYWEPQEAYKYGKVPVEPKWKYLIRAVKKVNDSQVKYIKTHEWELENKIRENRKPTLEILGL